MASNKLRNVGITQGNRQKLPLNSTFRRSTSDDQTARTNLKRKTVESSQVNEDMDDRSRIFRPWQSLSEPLDSVGDEIDEIGEWEKLRKWAAACVVVYGAYAASLVFVESVSHVGRPLPKPDEGDIHRQFFMSRLTQRKDQDCRNEFRMGKEAFGRLVCILRDSGRLMDTRCSTVEEQVAKFLHIIGHNRRNYSVKLDYWRSGETVSRHFHKVLKAIISLESLFMKQPDGSECPLEISNNSRFFPYFKDCIGAIDGSHFRVRAPSDVVQRYRGRKQYPTINVLAACSFDLKFTYVLSGWEGSASDSRVLNSALNNRIDRLEVPDGKYYLVDAGYQLRRGFITPYRKTRYHLKEYSVLAPRNAKEIFNHRHSSLRNAIERAFGVLKKRFAILGSGNEPFYSVKTQADVVLAGCILHNYLMGVDPDLDLIEEVDREILESSSSYASYPANSTSESREVEEFRNSLANAMWRDYSTGHNTRSNR